MKMNEVDGMLVQGSVDQLTMRGSGLLPRGFCNLAVCGRGWDQLTADLRSFGRNHERAMPESDEAVLEHI
jgi:hypothetical protein